MAPRPFPSSILRCRDPVKTVVSSGIRPRLRTAVVTVSAAALLTVALAALLLVGTQAAAIQEGDEAIYAQNAREMVEGGDWATLRWQGEPQFPRPPLSVWVMAVGRALAGPTHAEAAVRWPLALAVGLEIVLVALLAARLARRSEASAPRLAVGMVAGGLLLGSDLVVGYARFVESEPFLCVAIVGAALAWEHARASARRGPIVVWGALVGAATLTKQIIGAIPLLWPVVEAVWWRLARAPRPMGRRRLELGLAVAVLVWLPWHVVALARHGSRFLEVYLLEAVVRRGAQAVLHVTRPSYYLRELWRSEDAGAILFGAGLVAAAIAVGRALVRPPGSGDDPTVTAAATAARERGRVGALLLAWTLAPMAVFTASASRYDHYPLVVYPALALALALAIDALPVGRALRGGLAVAVVALGLVTHTARDLTAPFAGADELRALARVANQLRPRTVFLFNLHPYATRFYLDPAIATRTLLETQHDLDEGLAAARKGQPVVLTLAPDPIAALRAAPQPSLLVLPRARASLLAGAPAVAVVGATARYLLVATR